MARATREKNHRRPRAATAAVLLLLAAPVVMAAGSLSWPRTSRHTVEPIACASLDSRVSAVHPPAQAGYEFAAFGDQRALLGSDWPALVDSLDYVASRHERLLFLIDTGDIVDDGDHSDQFRVLSGLLGKIRRLPYLVAAGNHEVGQSKPGPARANTAKFLSPLDGSISPDRLYYRKVVGRVRYLFLDSNDLVYRPGPGSRADRAIEVRAHAQLDWLIQELQDPAYPPSATTVVVMHHPFVQSSRKHRGQSQDLWSLRYHGRQFPDILADGGVDLVLVGHTHTFERFTVMRRDNRGFHLVNLSGTPEPSFLWFGAGERRAQEIHGDATPWLYEKGWRNLDGWTVSQEDVMVKDEADQFGLFNVDAEGGISLTMHFLGRAPGPPTRLLWGARDSVRVGSQK